MVIVTLYKSPLFIIFLHDIQKSMSMISALGFKSKKKSLNTKIITATKKTVILLTKTMSIESNSVELMRHTQAILLCWRK